MAKCIKLFSISFNIYDAKCVYLKEYGMIKLTKMKSKHGMQNLSNDVYNVKLE